MVTAEQEVVLTGDSLEVTAGCEVLDFDLTLNATYGDISDDLIGGSVTWNGDAKIHRTVRLTLSVELPWGSVLVRPYMVLNGVRFDVGVFALTTPEKPLGEDPVTFQVQGYDRVYLLDRKIGDDYTVTSGTSYYDALVQLFTDAGLDGYLIDGDADDYTLPADRDWPLIARTTDPNSADATKTPTTWLRAINDLLLAVNFRGVWADENGIFRCERYLEPSVRAPRFTFDADDPDVSIVAEDRTETRDEFKAPNRWVFLWSNGGTGIVGDGIYEVPGTADEVARRGGLDWPEVFEYEAASQAVLESLGDRRVASDRRVATVYKVSTGPFPAASHWDVFTYTDEAIGGSVKVQASDWELDLLGGNTSWTWEAIS